MRRALLLGSALVSAALGCTTDHSQLARRPQNGGAGGADAGPGGGGGSGGSGGDPVSGGSGGMMEPGEPDRVTFVHGLSDASSIQLCFARSGGEPIGAPLPESGLPYGAALALGDSPGVDFGTDDLDVLLFAGELEQIAGLDCAAAVEHARELGEQAVDAGVGAAGAAGAGGAGAPGPALSFAPLLRIPAGTFFAGRSALLVAKGCFAGRTAPDVQAVCGPDYAPLRASLEAVIVELSTRIEFDKVGVQVVHASTDAGRLDVSLRLADGSSRPLAAGLEPGTLAPLTTPAFVAEQDQLGAGAGLELRAPGTGALLQDLGLAQALELGGVAALQDARSYALVVIGPSPSLRTEGFWNAPALSVVPARPD